MDSVDQWYYHDGSQTVGPVSAAHIAQLIRARSLHAETPIAQAGASTWSPASIALAHLLRPPPAAAAPAAAPTYAIRVECISGPDKGSAFMIAAQEVALGRASGIGLHDPHVSDNHVLLSWQNNVLYFRGAAGATIRVAGMDVAHGALSNGQQFQMGLSIWQVGTVPVDLGGLIGNLGDRLRQLASADRLEGFSLRALFSEVFHGRKPGEIDEYFVVGSDRTTPGIDSVQTGWPRPWFFFRVLAFMVVVYGILYYSFEQFNNAKLVPGLMMMGALAVPLATVFFFFELNTPRNVTFAKTLMLVCLGGVASLFLALVGFKFGSLGWMGASQAGIVEEIGKLLAVVLVVRQTKYKYILNGMLFGAAIGCGFSAFETAGYSYEGFLLVSRGWIMGVTHAADLEACKPFFPNAPETCKAIQNTLVSGNFGILKTMLTSSWGVGFKLMFEIIQDRSLLAPFGHIVWTAISAGALWRVKGDRPFHARMLIEPSFLRAMFIPMALHATWNLPDTFIPDNWVGTLERVGLGVVGYFVAFSLVQQGLRQVREEQLAHTRSTYRQSQEILTASGRFRAPS